MIDLTNQLEKAVTLGAITANRRFLSVIENDNQTLYKRYADNLMKQDMSIAECVMNVYEFVEKRGLDTSDFYGIVDFLYKPAPKGPARSAADMVVAAAGKPPLYTYAKVI